MAKLVNINFAHVGRLEGCTCDRCGQYIQNVWTVTDSDGVTFHYGIDCFEKLGKESRLTSYGVKLFKKLLGRLQRWNERLERWESGEMTEECDEWLCQQADWHNSYWKGRPFAEYKDWMISDFIPAQIEDCQKELDQKFGKVNWKF